MDSSPQTISLPSLTSEDIASLGNITLSSGGSAYTYSTGITSASTISIGGFGSNTLNSGVITGAGGYCYTSGAGISGINTWNIHVPQEWIDCFPDFARIEKMCEQYPGLKIAFEKFKTTYKLVKDHYDTPEDQRPRP